MKVKLALAGISAALVAPLAALTIAQAAVPPSIERGDIYRVKNLTKNTDFTDPNSADKCEVLQYKVRIHNPGPEEIAKNVTVHAVLPTGATTKNVSAVVIKADNISPTSASDTATVNLSTSLKIAYVSGSSQLLDANGNFITTLPDVVNSAAVNIGKVGVSVNEKRFVQFKAKVDCPTPPPEKPVFKCEFLKITVGKDRNVKISGFQTSAANGAVYKNATLDWGDSSAPTTAVELVGLSHTYSQDGTFLIRATAHFTVDGETKSATSQACAQKVTFKPNQPPEVVPPPEAPEVPVAGKGGPTELVDTGPGSIAAIFGTVTAAGAMAHRWMLGRRLDQ